MKPLEINLDYLALAQLCPTLCDPMDDSLPGSSVHGLFQARLLKWVAISFSRVDLSRWALNPMESVLSYIRNRDMWKSYGEIKERQRLNDTP